MVRRSGRCDRTDGECVTARKDSLDVFYEGSEGEGRMIDGKGAMQAADQDRAARIQPVNDWPFPSTRKIPHKYMRPSWPFRSLFCRQNNTKS
jgi:hypothetical protein